jgi:hypothetical protein
MTTLLVIGIVCKFTKVTVEPLLIGVEFRSAVVLLTDSICEDEVSCVTYMGKVKVNVDNSGIFVGQVKVILMGVEV